MVTMQCEEYIITTIRYDRHNIDVVICSKVFRFLMSSKAQPKLSLAFVSFNHDNSNTFVFYIPFHVLLRYTYSFEMVIREFSLHLGN